MSDNSNDEVKRDLARKDLLEGAASESTKRSYTTDEDVLSQSLAQYSESEVEEKKIEARSQLSSSGEISPKEKKEVKIDNNPHVVQIKTPATLDDQTKKALERSERYVLKKEAIVKQKPVKRNTYSFTQKNVRSDIPTNVTGVRTIRGDLREKIKKDNISVAQIAVSERETIRSRNQEIYLAAQKKRQMKVVGVTLGLLLLGSGIVYLLFFRTVFTPVVVENIDSSSIVFSEGQEIINIDRLGSNDFRIRIKELLSKQEIPQGAIHDIIFTRKSGKGEVILSSEEYFKALNISLPASLTRALEPVFMYGIFANPQNEGFYIFKTNSFESAFSAMIDWESVLFEDLISTMKRGLQVRPSTNWEDLTINNINTRVLRSPKGNVIMLYSFVDRETLIISADERTFFEAFLRHTTIMDIVI